MEGGLALCVARGENLVDVGLATAGGPAAAVAVLHCAGDTGVEGPESGHVAVEAAVAVEGHVEVEEEDFVGAAEALYKNSVLVICAPKRCKGLAYCRRRQGHESNRSSHRTFRR